MTRVQKNEGVYRKKRVAKKNWKWFIKAILRSIISFIVGLVYIMYKLIRGFNNLVAKIFMKLPRLLRVVVVYSMIGMVVYTYINPKTIIKEVVKEEVFKIKLDKPVVVKEPVKEEKKEECSLGDIECKIYNKALEKGLSKEQSLIVVSISRHETGNWTSKAFHNKNNFGGVMCRTGLKSYTSFDEGLEHFVSLLKSRYFDRGLDTIEKIGKVYCPVGASNDPTGVNKNWIPNVTRYFNGYVGE